MSQYQRLISYLYRYEKGAKKENTGYARIELRGEYCKITVQLQENVQNSFGQQMPEVALFVQREWGMERIAAGSMLRNGNGYRCSIKTKSDNVLDSGKAFSDLDGLLLYLNDDLFYATTWKDVSVVLGENDASTEVKSTPEIEWKTEIEPERETEEIKEVKEDRKIKESEMAEAEKAESEKTESEEEMEKEPEKAEPEKEMKKEPEAELRIAQMEENDIGEEKKTEEMPAKNKGKDCQQCDCQYCPQNGRDVDFGSRILSVFPRMYPFQIENIGECVRLELKDMGYLPVEHWSLAGNPFLLHGYYCYRHIIFTRLGSQGCCIGVPGIFNPANQKKAEEYGFRQFQSLSEVKDIHGAFGYWLYPLENQSAR